MRSCFVGEISFVCGISRGAWNRVSTIVLSGVLCPVVHRGQTSEHAREIARDRLIRKTLHVAVTTAASSCELEAKFSFYLNEVHWR